MKTPGILLLLLSTAQIVVAGTISGTVRAEGREVPEQQGGAGQYDSRKYKFIERIDYSELRDFVVYIEGPAEGTTTVATNTPPAGPARVSQKDGAFTPRVLPVLQGTPVEWPNEDEIFHNVFSMSEPKPFDLGLYRGNPPEKRVTFDKPGRVDVYCSIHANMHCIVLVLKNPWFDSTDARGRYSITNVPPGTYRVKAWHERLPAQEKEVTVPENGDATCNFVLGISNLPRY